ncbi:MAG: hypothetical protein LBQ50_02420 [Planctomycetaceae bacterium]|jgi:hypothetical protein|nr:hypothetical protein [Planctomycetaceae bacterium]
MLLLIGSEQNPIQEDLQERGFTSQICEKGVRNNLLTSFQRFCNRIKSSVRCRIEHIFGAQKNERVMRPYEPSAEKEHDFGSECEIW